MNPKEFVNAFVGKVNSPELLKSVEVVLKARSFLPDHQIVNLRILCDARATDTLLVPNDVDKFKEGQSVRIIGGTFKGITGTIARWHGQQRVGINLDGIGTIATAYVPSAFIEWTA